MSKEVYNILANNNILVSEPIGSGATIVDVGNVTPVQENTTTEG